MYEITLEHTTDTGHRIVGHKGKCARLHGHTYRWLVTVRSMYLVFPGFVVDFGDIKDVLNEWDHYTLLWVEDPVSVAGVVLYNADATVEDAHVIRVPFNPTAENMAKHMAERLRRDLDVEEVEVVVFETPKSSAKWVAS